MKIRRFSAAVLAALAVCAVMNAAEYTFTIGTHATDESIEARSFYWFSDQVKQRSGGRLQINVSTAAALGGAREIIEAMNFGAIEMGLGENALYSNYVPAFGILSLPFIHPSTDKFIAAADGEVGQRLNRLLEEKTNMTVLAWLDGIRTRDVYSRIPLNSLADMKGLKIRTPESPVQVATFRAFSANPTPIPAPEMYTALQQNVVMAMEGTTETAVNYGIYELAKNYLETHHMVNECSVVINRDALAELPDDLRKILVDCAKEMTQWNRALCASDSDGYKRRMLEADVKFVAIDAAKAKEMVGDVYRQYIGGDPIMQEVFDLLMAVQKR